MLLLTKEINYARVLNYTRSKFMLSMLLQIISRSNLVHLRYGEKISRRV